MGLTQAGGARRSVSPVGKTDAELTLAGESLARDARDGAVGELIGERGRGEPSTRAIPLIGPVTHADDGERGDLRVGHRKLAALDPLRDDVLEQPTHRAAPRAHAREFRRGQREPLAQVDADGVEVGGHRHDVHADHVAQAIGRAAAPRGDRLELVDRAGQRALEQPREKLLLRTDVVIKAALEQADRLGDVLNAGAVIALLAKDASRGGQDLTLAGGVAAISPTASWRNGARGRGHFRAAVRSRSYSAMRANTPPSPAPISFVLRCATSFARRAARAKSGVRSGTRFACSPSARATWMCASDSVMRAAFNMNGSSSSSLG